MRIYLVRAKSKKLVAVYVKAKIHIHLYIHFRMYIRLDIICDHSFCPLLILLCFTTGILLLLILFPSPWGPQPFSLDQQFSGFYLGKVFRTMWTTLDGESINLPIKVSFFFLFLRKSLRMFLRASTPSPLHVTYARSSRVPFPF